jgi:hypothetical protein
VHALFERRSRYEGTYADRERLEHVQIMLDQSWDLLRQRRARLAAGLDPDEPQVTDAKTSGTKSGDAHGAQIDRVLDDRESPVRPSPRGSGAAEGCTRTSWLIIERIWLRA